MTANTIKAIAFDLDGTLVDSIPDLAESANCMRHHFSLPPLSLATLKSYVGDGTGLSTACAYGREQK